MSVGVKICGLTTKQDIAYINELKPKAAGFVVGYPKSKRNLPLSEAELLMKEVDQEILKVAVTVSPEVAFAREIEEAGFDVLQIHGEFDKRILDECEITIWRAANIKESLDAYHEAMKLPKQVKAVVLDGANAGGGKTFDWEQAVSEIKERTKLLILAGGLNRDNVAQGIKTFHPDLVDVSSGVEGTCGKDREKIQEFMTEVTRNG
ncbi:MAG: phosphoribosylanthranilate isomerase [Eubacterium sp.]|nr:phosphoribosylanthranilate isomerase [Eubacterium sp.]